MTNVLRNTLAALIALIGAVYILGPFFF